MHMAPIVAKVPPTLQEMFCSRSGLCSQHNETNSTHAPVPAYHTHTPSFYRTLPLQPSHLITLSRVTPGVVILSVRVLTSIDSPSITTVGTRTCTARKSGRERENATEQNRKQITIDIILLTAGKISKTTEEQRPARAIVQKHSVQQK